MYPISATFLIKSPGTSFSDDIFLFLCRSASPEFLRRAAREKNAFSAALYDERSGEVIGYDDGGNEIERYRSTVSSKEDDSSSHLFSTFLAGDCLCGISGGEDLLIPEHSRVLALSSVEVLCCFPSEDSFIKYPLREVARVRAIENQFFVLLVPPCGEEILCWEPTGAPASVFEGSGGERLFILKRGDIVRLRKKVPLLFLRKKQFRDALAVL